MRRLQGNREGKTEGPDTWELPYQKSPRFVSHIVAESSGPRARCIAPAGADRRAKELETEDSLDANRVKRPSDLCYNSESNYISI